MRRTAQCFLACSARPPGVHGSGSVRRQAHLSLENTDAITNAGGTPYIAIKSKTTGMIGGSFEAMYHSFCLNRDAYLTHYHKRSNVESTMNMMKAKFGDSVRSKTDVAMTNEALCKVLCHNLCCLISAIYELGLTVELGGETWGRILGNGDAAVDPDETAEAFAWM